MLSKCVCVYRMWEWGLLSVREAGEWMGDSKPLSVSLPGTIPQGHFKSAHPEMETPIGPLSNSAKSSQVRSYVHLCMCVSAHMCPKMLCTGRSPGENQKSDRSILTAMQFLSHKFIKQLNAKTSPYRIKSWLHRCLLPV